MNDYILTASTDHNGSSNIRLEPTSLSHSFWVFDKLIHVSIKNSDLLTIANIVSSVNALGEKYWYQLESQAVTHLLPYEITSHIRDNIKAYTRGLKIDSVIEDPELVDDNLQI